MSVEERLDRILQGQVEIQKEVTEASADLRVVRALAESTSDRLDATDKRVVEFWRTTWVELQGELSDINARQDILDARIQALLDESEDAPTVPSSRQRVLESSGSALGGVGVFWFLQQAAKAMFGNGEG